MKPGACFSNSFSVGGFLLAIAIVLFTDCLRSGKATAHAEDQAAKELRIDVRPYRVSVLVAFDAPQISAAGRQDILNETRQATQRYVGEMWQLHVESVDWIQPINVDGLSRIEAATLQNQNQSDQQHETDIWFVATIQAARPGYQIDVRSWQPEIELATEPIGVHVADPRDIPLRLLSLCRLSFRSTGVVEEVDGNTAIVRLRAGALIPPDESFRQVQPGTLFAPIIALRNREKRIEKIQSIPWTYLLATDIDGPRATCEISSGLRSPIGGKQRGRLETMAVSMRPQFAATRLELATQTRPSLPLMAHRIELRSAAHIPAPDDASARQEHLLSETLTDRRGFVFVPADAERPLVWLFAYSGQHLLARVPFVPGSLSDVRLEVPNDAARLTAEADVQMLQGQLVDAVAMRNTHYAAIRAAAKKNDRKTVQSKLDEIPTLPDATSFLDRLAAIRVSAINLARESRDRAAEARIDRLCNNMAELIKQYLSDDKAKLLQEEMTDLLNSELTSP